MTTTESVKIFDLLHPYYLTRAADWQLWRDTYESGRAFIENYLERFTDSETAPDFETRRRTSYCPAYAKKAIYKIKNAIYSKMWDVARKEGPNTYQEAVHGDWLGVDLKGSSMNTFMGQEVLPELLVMSKVGVFIDKPPIVDGETILDTKDKRPYMYIYRAEEILNWVCHTPYEFDQLVLREHFDVIDPQYGLSAATGTRYRHMYKQDGGIYVAFYNTDGKLINIDNQLTDLPIFLNINKIPFVVFEISNSLLADIARYQIALMNLASSDLLYVLSQNFPLYVEQQDFRATMPYVRQQLEDDKEPDQAGPQQVKTGSARGRAYGKGLDKPGYINPSPETLKASMDKQEQLKKEIDDLMLLTLSDVQAKSATPSDQVLSGVESGLAAIALVMEAGEQKIARFWAMYENAEPAFVNYPETFDLVSDSEKLDQADKLGKVSNGVPSKTFKQEINKEISRKLLNTKVDAATLEKIETEIENAKAFDTDSETLTKDVEAGILDKKTAAELKGYPKDTVEKAQQEHIQRLETIAISQAKGGGAARGVPDLTANPNDGKVEKKDVKVGQDLNPTPIDPTRGKGA